MIARRWPDRPRELTASEQNAIAALRRLAKRWPKTLTLVSMDGGLQVVDTAIYHAINGPETPDAATRQGMCVLADINGIPNDGGGW